MEPDQIDDLNSGFVQELLTEYLASPESVDPEWRELFESNQELVLERLPNAGRLRELNTDGDNLARRPQGCGSASRILATAAVRVWTRSFANTFEVSAHGSRRDPELPGDLGVGQPLGHEQDDLMLPPCQRGGAHDGCAP